jgi:hypothetical protein
MMTKVQVDRQRWVLHVENEVEQSPRLETLERPAEAFEVELAQLVATEG